MKAHDATSHGLSMEAIAKWRHRLLAGYIATDAEEIHVLCNMAGWAAINYTPTHEASSVRMEFPPITQSSLTDDGAPKHPYPQTYSIPSETRPIYTVEQLESWQQSFENLRREFHRQGNHDGQRGCEFALEAIRLYQTGTTVSATPRIECGDPFDTGSCEYRRTNG